MILVDGFKIRNTLDDDFGVLGVHSQQLSWYLPKWYIPAGEVWLDHHYQDEADWLHQLELFTVPDATANYLQKKEQAKQKFCLPPPVPNFTISRERLTGPAVESAIEVVLVDGKIIRRYLDPEFILGGHHYVYDYIPESEIWLDGKMDPAEQPYILLHEQVERDLMKRGQNYDIAHEQATVADKQLRRERGGAAYPGDANYPWFNLSNEAIIKKYYV